MDHPAVRSYLTSKRERRYKFPLQPEVVNDLSHLEGLGDHIDLGLYKAWGAALSRSDGIKEMDPESINFDYDFKLSPFDHQKIALAFARNLPAAALFMETGTGKTFVALSCSEMRIKKGVVNKVLAIAPKSILRGSWWEDCKKFTDLKSIVVHKDLSTFRWGCPMCDKSVLDLSDSHAKEHYKEFNALASLFGGEELTRKDTTSDRFSEFFPIPDEMDWNNYKTIDELLGSKYELYITTPEMVALNEDSFIRSGFDMVILDESTLIKNPTSNRTEAITRVGFRAKFRLILSGTPITNSLEDIWSQMYFLDQSLGSSFSEFKNKYFMRPSPHEYPMFWVPRKGADEAIVERIKDRSIRITKEECLDLPPRTVKMVDVEMSSASKKAYKTMTDHLYALIENTVTLNVRRRISDTDWLVSLPMGINRESAPSRGMVFDGDLQLGQAFFEGEVMSVNFTDDLPEAVELKQVEGEVTTSIKLSQFIKLQQITNGFILETSPEGKRITHILDEIPNKIKEVKSILSNLEPDRKVIIWAQYHADFAMLEKYLDSTVSLNGATPGSQIEERVNAFKGDTRIMIAHPASAQYGHTWNEANIVIYYSLSYSLLQYMQSRDRCYRIGQKNPVLEIILIGSPTDRLIYDSLMNNKGISEKITNNEQLRSVLAQIEI